VNTAVLLRFPARLTEGASFTRPHYVPTALADVVALDLQRRHGDTPEAREPHRGVFLDMPGPVSRTDLTFSVQASDYVVYGYVYMLPALLTAMRGASNWKAYRAGGHDLVKVYAPYHCAVLRRLDLEEVIRELAARAEAAATLRAALRAELAQNPDLDIPEHRGGSGTDEQ